MDCSLAPSPRAPAAARTMTQRWLGDVLDATIEDSGRAVSEAALIVSELVTNAVQAQPHYVRLLLAVAPEDPAVLSIAVEDDAPGSPQLARPDDAKAAASSVRGRGLVLVDALARRWGTRWLDAGKSVWAELAIPSSRPWPQPA